MVNYLPAEARHLNLIAPDVRKTIRGLITGQLPWPLFLHGPAGVGKTLASLCLVDLVESAFYHTTEEWVALAINVDRGKQVWRAEGGDVTVTPPMLERRYRGAALVVLDELATRGQVADWHYEKVKALVDWRSRLPFVVISNTGIAGVEKIYDDRLASRISSGTVLELPGSDRRLHGGSHGRDIGGR